MVEVVQPYRVALADLPLDRRDYQACLIPVMQLTQADVSEPGSALVRNCEHGPGGFRHHLHPPSPALIVNGNRSHRPMQRLGNTGDSVYWSYAHKRAMYVYRRHARS